jgi:hypothetical protein
LSGHVDHIIGGNNKFFNGSGDLLTSGIRLSGNLQGGGRVPFLQLTGLVCCLGIFRNFFGYRFLRLFLFFLDNDNLIFLLSGFFCGNSFLWLLTYPVFLNAALYRWCFNCFFCGVWFDLFSMFCGNGNLRGGCMLYSGLNFIFFVFSLFFLFFIGNTA